MAPRRKRKPFPIQPIEPLNIQPIGAAQITPLGAGQGATLPNNWEKKYGDLLSSGDKDSGPFEVLKGAGKIGLDILSAPGRAVGGLIAEGKKDGFDVLDIPRGIAHLGDDKYDPSDVLKADGFVESLLVDVALDPLTYLSGGTFAAAKGAVKGTAKGVAKATAKDAGKSKGVLDEIARESEAGLKKAQNELKAAVDEQATLKTVRKIAPKDKAQRQKMRRQADEKSVKAEQSRQAGKGILKKNSPFSLTRLRERINTIQKELPEARKTAVQEAVSLGATAAKFGDEAAAAVKPGGKSSDDIAKELGQNQKQIARAEVKRNNTKPGTKERGSANQEIYNLRAKNKELEAQQRAATNSKNLETSARKQIEADDAMRTSEEVYDNAVTDALTGAPIKGLEDVALKTVANLGKSVRGATQSATRASQRVTKLEDELIAGQQQLDQADDLVRQGQGYLDEAGRLSQEADDLRRAADADVSQIDKRLNELAGTVETYQQTVARYERQLKAIYEADSAQELARRFEKIKDRIITPAMRNIEPDEVQRKIFFAVMGVKIPGISDNLAIAIGKPYSRATKRAAFAEKYPRLSDLRDKLGQTFIPAYGLPKILAAAERNASNIARADSEEGIQAGFELWNKVSREEQSVINKVLERADDENLDLANAASRALGQDGKERAAAQLQYDQALAKSNANPVKAAETALSNAPRGSRIAAEKKLNEARKAQKNLDEAKVTLDDAIRNQTAREELLDVFNNLSVEARDFIEHILGVYRASADADVAFGFLDNPVFAYSSRHRILKNEDQQVMSINEMSLMRDPGYLKSRKLDKVDEEINAFEAFALREIQSAQMRQAFIMVRSLHEEVGKKFDSEELAKAAGFIKPDKGLAKGWLPDDVYLPREIANGLDRVQEIWSSPRALNAFTRKWGTLNGMFKNLAYTINPGHFAIDSIGDTWNMWLAQVPIFDPRYMASSIQIAKDIEVYESALRRGLAPPKATVKMNNGLEVELEDLSLALKANGLRNLGRSAGRSGRMDNEADDWLTGRPPSRFSPRRLGRSASNKMQTAGNFRDNTFRSYGMIAQLQKNLDDGMEFGLALSAAGNTIRFSTFDYNELTSTEKRIFRNVMPFYTWTRKNIPYQLNRLVAVPGRVTLPFKVQEASFNQEGAPDLSLLQPFTRNTNFLLPDPIANLLPGSDEASLFFNPMIPSMDLGRFQSYRIDGEDGPIPGVEITEPIGMLSPYLKAIPELGMNREFFSGREIGSAPSYILRTFLGQPGGQTVKQLSPDSAGYETVGVGPTDMRLNQITGLLGQFGGFRSYALEENPAMAARAARMQAIEMRKSSKETARREAGNLFTLPLIGVDVPNPFYY